jgi:hypothetical protein
MLGLVAAISVPELFRKEEALDGARNGIHCRAIFRHRHSVGMGGGHKFARQSDGM